MLSFCARELGALTTENAQGEFYLTDLIQMAAAKITEEETLPATNPH